MFKSTWKNIYRNILFQRRLAWEPRGAGWSGRRASYGLLLLFPATAGCWFGGGVLMPRVSPRLCLYRKYHH